MYILISQYITVTLLENMVWIFGALEYLLRSGVKPANFESRRAARTFDSSATYRSEDVDLPYERRYVWGQAISTHPMV